MKHINTTLYPLLTDLDIDKWRCGRRPNGEFDRDYLKASYPYVEVGLRQDRLIAPHAAKVRTILDENIALDHEERPNWMHWAGVIYFIDKEDAEVFRALLYIY